MTAIQRPLVGAQGSATPSSPDIFSAALSDMDAFRSFNHFSHDPSSFDCPPMKGQLLPSGYEQVPRSMSSFQAINRPSEFGAFGFDQTEFVADSMEDVETLQPALMSAASAYALGAGSAPSSLNSPPGGYERPLPSMHPFMADDRINAHHGQYTPPHDYSSQDADGDELPYDEQTDSMRPVKSRSKKGHKSRQRSGGPTRKSRKMSKTSSELENMNPEEMAKRDKFLERNRVAASKCRQKKKEWTNGLESQARELALSRARLSAYVATLKDEVLFLKGEMLKHTDCNCTRIHEYIGEQASMIAPGSRTNTNTNTSTSHTSQTSSGFSCMASPTSEESYSSGARRSPKAVAASGFDERVMAALAVPLRNSLDRGNYG